MADVATVDGFARNPATVQRFYNRLRRRLFHPDVVPNPAHHALVRFERYFQPNFHLVTQNIDDLHQRVGSQHITAMHGELKKIRNARADWRPHVVWFGERTIGLPQIMESLAAAEVFIVNSHQNWRRRPVTVPYIQRYSQ